MFVWTKTISDSISRMMVGSQGKYKKAVEKDCNVNVNVVPISRVIGSLWSIEGDEANVNLALDYYNGIYLNTVVKPGKSKLTSPFVEDYVGERKEISTKRDNALKDALEKEKKIRHLEVCLEERKKVINNQEIQILLHKN